MFRRKRYHTKDGMVIRFNPNQMQRIQAIASKYDSTVDEPDSIPFDPIAHMFVTEYAAATALYIVLHTLWSECKEGVVTDETADMTERCLQFMAERRDIEP